LIQATDGNFYSTSNNCNEFVSCGAFVDIYKVTPTGTLTVVEKLTGANGAGAYWTLIQDTNGTLYGITQQGGTANGGVFFSLNIGAKAFVSLVSTAGRVGSKIGILGQGFSASSVVKFNGVEATTVTRTGTTFLLATVPAGANDGYVTVTTGTNTLTSSQKFIVHNSWAAGAPMPVAAVAACSAVLNGQIYVVGGYNSSAQTAVQIYNPTTNKWSTGTALSSALSNQACAAVNGEVYEFGGTPNTGSSQTNAVWAYSPATKTWTSKHAMPTARQDIVAVVANNLVYVIGGYNGNRVSTVEAYNPATDTWSTESSVLVAQSGEVGGVVAGNIVISGGAGESTDTGDTESYSVSGNAWTSLKADATVRNNPCGGVVGAALYVAGGANRAGSSFTVNESFAPSKDAWTTLSPLPQASTDPASAVSGGQLFCFGGFTGLGGATLNNVQVYQP
jgi:N-acetylneuraminic acid mutarotase